MGSEEYWAKVGGILKKINPKACLISGTDNNGQVAQRDKGGG